MLTIANKVKFDEQIFKTKVITRILENMHVYSDEKLRRVRTFGASFFVKAIVCYFDLYEYYAQQILRSGCFLTAIMHLLEFIKIALVFYIKVKPPETYYEQGRKIFRVIL